MNKRMIGNNRVTISGEIVSDFEFSHEVFGEKFYNSRLMIKRSSGVADFIPITVSDRLVEAKADWEGRKVKVGGQFRSYNRHEGNKSRLILSVFVREFEEIGDIPFLDDENNISIEGFICKKQTYRKTPHGREISDVMIAVNRPYGKSDYIPCVIWGRNARFADSLEVGARVKIDGRIQSREYQKKISDDGYEIKTAYEVSASKISLVEETEDSKHEEED